ncbi:MAG: hypothetical protein J5684_00145, partial [Eubacterium sp.]|nr:hypothetical protein [Eubacterium sp.]
MKKRLRILAITAIFAASLTACGSKTTEADNKTEELTEVTTEELKELVAKYKAYYKKTFNEEFPTDPRVQLMEAVAAVFRS